MSVHLLRKRSQAAIFEISEEKRVRQNSKVHVKVNFVLKTIRKLLKDLRDEFKKKYVKSLETNCFFLNLVHSTKVICVTRLLN